MPPPPQSADRHRADTEARVLVRHAARRSAQTHPRGRRGRWLLVVAVVLIGHAAALAWLGLHRTREAEPRAKPHVVVALLKTARIAASPDAPAAAMGSKFTHTHASEHRAPARAGVLQGIAPNERLRVTPPKAAPVATPAPDVQKTVVGTPIHASPRITASTAAADTSAQADATAPASDTAANTAGVPTAGTAASSTRGAPGSADGSGSDAGGSGGSRGTDNGERYALMPSSDLVYDTFYNGAQNQSGTLRWRTNGKQYELVVSMPVPFIGTYSFISQGHIDAFGLAPDVYTEHRGRRGTDISRFERDGASHQVAFTRTPQTVPLPDGAQDRFSMIFQLASLVRGNPQRYQPGVTREFDVIDSNSAEIWPIQTIGPDTVVRPDGPIQAVHFMRLPRRAGDNRRIDIWLAPALDWIPVRIMQTEPSGTQIELLYRSSMQMPPVSVRLDSAGAVADTGTPAPTGGASGVADTSSNHAK